MMFVMQICQVKIEVRGTTAAK